MCSHGLGLQGSLVRDTPFYIFTSVSAAPVAVNCMNRWRAEGYIEMEQEFFDVTVSWSPPINRNGIVLAFILKLVNFTGAPLTESVRVNSSVTSFTFRRQSLGKCLLSVLLLLLFCM